MLSVSTHRDHINVIVNQDIREMAIHVEVCGYLLGPGCSKHHYFNKLVSSQKLTDLASTISNLQVFLLKKCECKSYYIFFSKNISIY